MIAEIITIHITASAINDSQSGSSCSLLFHHIYLRQGGHALVELVTLLVC